MADTAATMATYEESAVMRGMLVKRLRAVC